MAIVAPGDESDADAAAGERWRTALTMFQTGVQGDWALPAFLQYALVCPRPRPRIARPSGLAPLTGAADSAADVCC